MRADASSTDRPVWRRPLVSVLVSLLVVAGLSMIAATDDPDRLFSYTDVAVGETASLRAFDVTVTEIQVTRSVSRTTEPAVTGHSFVVATLEAVVRTEGQSFTEIRLQTRDGREYKPRPEWPLAGLPSTQPGFSARGQVVFEVPQPRLAGAVLFVGDSTGELTTFDGAARVDLGLSSDTTISAGPVVLGEPTQWVSA